MKNRTIILRESELVNVIERLVKEEDMMEFMDYDDADPIEVMRINKENLKSKKLTFYEYEIKYAGYLILFDEIRNVSIEVYDGEFVDSDNFEIIYKPMNQYAKEVFSKII